MAKFIELEIGKGIKRIFNTKHIIFVAEGKEPDTSILMLSNNDVVSVNKSYQEIISLLGAIPNDPTSYSGNFGVGMI